MIEWIQSGFNKSIRAESNQAYIYALVDPTTGLIRYIGKTCKSLSARLGGHKQDSINNKTRKERWIAKLLRLGVHPVIELIEIVPRENWKEFERAWISKLRKLGFDLTNLTDGGDGTDGYIMPDEVRERIRQKVRLIIKEHPIDFTPEVRQKISKALKGKPKSKEHRAKLSKAQTGKPCPMAGKHHTEEAKAKIREARKHQVIRHSPESRAKIGLAHKGKYVSEETKQKLREVNLGKKHTEETKAKISAGNKGKGRKKKNKENNE